MIRRFYRDAIVNLLEFPINFYDIVNEENIVPTKKDDIYTYRMDFAGVKKEDIDIEIKNNMCVISAKRVIGNESREIAKYFSIPKHVDKENISAKLADGVLEIALTENIPEKEKPLKIKIE